MTLLDLTALEGTHPLAFMAALGVLRLVDDEGLPARLAFPEGHAVLECPLDGPGLVDLLGRVVQTRATSRELSFAPVLKHAPEAWSAFLSGAREGALSRQPDGQRSARFFAAYASDLVTASTGDTKPTAFDMTAGRQMFVQSLRDLTSVLAAAALSPAKPKRGAPKGPTLPDELSEALFGPWRYRDEQHALGWDPWAERLYAYVPGSPAREKPLSTRAAVWLAAESLSFFPVFARPSTWRVTLATTGVPRGVDGDPAFTWPVWARFCGVGAVRSLLASPELASCRSQASRAALGARGVRFACRSARGDSGTQGYAVFRPPEVIPVGDGG